jgi:hypothetical protein
MDAEHDFVIVNSKCVGEDFVVLALEEASQEEEAGPVRVGNSSDTQEKSQVWRMQSTVSARK